MKLQMRISCVFFVFLLSITVAFAAAPTHDDPVLASTEGTDFDDEDLTVSPQNSEDADGDTIYNIIAWYKDGAPYQGIHLPFDDGTATDYSGNENTVSGNATYTTSGRDGTGAYSFSGNTYLATPTDASISMTTATDDVVAMSFWMKTKRKAWQPLMIKQKEYGVTMGRNGGFILYSWGDNSGEIGSGYADNTWHYVVAVFEEGSEYRIYVDGTLIGTKATADTSASSTYDLEMGSQRSGKSYFKGTMDDVIVFNHDLSDGQVQALYDSYLTGANPFETIASDETTAGETWYAEVTPTDGVETGVTKQSNVITIIVASCPYSCSSQLCLYEDGSLVAEVDQIDSAAMSAIEYIRVGHGSQTFDNLKLIIDGVTYLEEDFSEAVGCFDTGSVSSGYYATAGTDNNCALGATYDLSQSEWAVIVNSLTGNNKAYLSLRSSTADGSIWAYQEAYQAYLDDGNGNRDYFSIPDKTTDHELVMCGNK
ncbi:LamG domain-containing protein [Candidatus Woesearchaeota archaeon]|nr:LamG domain-containing protein [Candidatus Woesearchaeota archaeon]